MATLNIKKYFSNYFSTKKWYSILSDAVFVIILTLLIIPATRTDVVSFFIRLTSFSPTVLSSDEQFNVSNQTNTWQLYDAEGSKVSFATLNEKPVFLNFWATWCPPCNAELPGIIDIYEKYKDDVNFVLVSDESMVKVKAFAKKNNFDSRLFYRSSAVPADFISQSIPTTFIISKKGVVVLSKKGAARWSSGSVEDILDKLITK